jgi:hypothetical protein
MSVSVVDAAEAAEAAAAAALELAAPADAEADDVYAVMEALRSALN